MSGTSRWAIALIVALFNSDVLHAAQRELATVTVQASDAAIPSGYDAVVESVRQTVIASQVSGAVVELPVKAGDVVKQGQVLLRIDARSAAQGTVAGQAQTQAARSALDLATKDVERQRHLFEKQYISQSAMERAEAQFRATSAQLKAQIAQASIASIQSDYFTIRAPYAGVIAELPVAPGDMLMPGKSVLTMYDPASLRLSASIPQTAIAGIVAHAPVKAEFPGLATDRQWLVIPDLQILPAIDASTHSVQVRADLPASLRGIAPGMFARIWLPLQGGTGHHVFVPTEAIVRRAEMTGLYAVSYTHLTLPTIYSV